MTKLEYLQKYWDEYAYVQECPAFKYKYGEEVSPRIPYDERGEWRGEGFEAWVKDGAPGYPHYYKRRRAIQDYEYPEYLRKTIMLLGVPDPSRFLTFGELQTKIISALYPKRDNE